MQEFSDAQDNKKLQDIREQEAEELARILSGRYGIPYIDLSTVSLNTDALQVIDEKDARNANVAAFDISGRKLKVAVLSPSNPTVDTILTDLKQRNIEPTLFLTSKKSLERAWGMYAEISKAKVTPAGLIDISSEQLAKLLALTKDVNDVKKQIEDITGSDKSQGVSRILEVVIAGALATGASDIHMEPEEESTRVRFRLDGILHDIVFLEHSAYKLITSRIKLISALKLNVKKSAQDGRFTIQVNKKEIEVRTSVLPGIYGETIVMRLLDPESISVNLEDMGIEPRLLQFFYDELKKPNGMVLVTGPTGSGKSTTLYAFLKKVNEQGTKIITIEDPVEYHLKGISQTQVNDEAGYTFLEGLRAALRQDPDIIMVGEIRDPETAKVAMNASLTGHLVFSTLHTNDAAGAIPRLVDLGANPKIIGSALNMAIAQRLVRRLCKVCKKEAVPNEKEKKVIDLVLKEIKEKRPDVIVSDGSKIWIPGEGCKACNGVGYKGRVGIFETIIVDSNVNKVISDRVNADEVKLAAKGQGILDMREDGIVKVLNGTTSMEELERVVELIKIEEK